ncbi:MAG TPA: hypothetical protein VLA67_04080 [Nitrospiraceae bacterium]|nr:hypothetical protein [Nitrospiraceae bacterium]
MSPSILAVRLVGPEERRLGTGFGNSLTCDAMAKASVPISSIRGSVEIFI